jgi:hypothetical protein
METRCEWGRGWPYVGEEHVSVAHTWHTRKNSKLNSYPIACKGYFTSAMHMSIVSLPPLVAQVMGHIYRRLISKLFFERGKGQGFGLSGGFLTF